MINWTELIIGIASIIVTAVLVPLLREKSKQIKTETLNYWLRTLMSAAETYFSDGEGKQKKQWVIDRVQEHLKGLDVAELENALESMFRQLVVEGILNNDAI